MQKNPNPASNSPENMNNNNNNNLIISPNLDEPENLWDWSDLLDFTFDQNPIENQISDHPIEFSTEPVRTEPVEPDRVRKRDPRLICENFLAGRVPCACPEMDAALEEEERILPDRKKSRLGFVSDEGELGFVRENVEMRGFSEDLEMRGFSENNLERRGFLEDLEMGGFSENLKTSEKTTSDLENLKMSGKNTRNLETSGKNTRDLDNLETSGKNTRDLDNLETSEKNARDLENLETSGNNTRDLEELKTSEKNTKKRGIRAKGKEMVVVRCQVPECGADIGELKGYHKRHRVCLGCANAKVVVLYGVGNRYCQQCGKFHILSDFDEGKRSCRRKLERHNNRRRRKSGDPVSVEKESEGIVSSDDLVCEDKNGNDGSYLSSQVAEREPLLESEEGKVCIPSSSSSPQNAGSDSLLTFVASDDTQINYEKDEPKSTHSMLYSEKKSDYTSACPTGRISFKLYDWNPAEFPRRLRHQIFQWLASMPVELEGYIRPGCTILTAFVAMPNFMWLKLLQEPVVYIGDLVAGPEKMLSGRGTFLVYLDNMIFRVLRDGSSVMRIKVEENSPRLHYVHPTYFEAGKPMEFVACGSNLLQPNFRFLVSFGGKYMAYDYSVATQHTNTKEATTFDNQLLKISIHHTEPDLFGPAFIEVDNQSGLSNFIPILIGNREICSELKIIEQSFEEPLCLQRSKLRVTSSSLDSCEVSSRQTSFSQFILDTAWLIRRPALEDIKHPSTSYQIGRLNRVLNVLVKKKSTILLVRVLEYIEAVMDLNSLSHEMPVTDMELLKKNMAYAKHILSGMFKEEDVSFHQSETLVHNANCSSETADSPCVVSSAQQDSETIEETKKNVVFSFDDHSDNFPLLNKEVIMNMTLMRDTPTRSLSRTFTKKYLISRPLLLVVASAAVCLCVCVVLIHPQEVGRIATTIRRSVFDSSET